MSLLSKRNNQSSSKFDRKPKRRSKLHLQWLETRRLLAGDVGLSDGVISIEGTQANDVAEVYREADTISVNLSSYGDDGTLKDNQSATFDAELVDRIVFQAGDGDDLFANDTSIDSIVRGGAGNDLLLGGSGNDMIVAGAGDDLVIGGGGNDLVLGGPGQDFVMPHDGVQESEGPVSDVGSSEDVAANPSGLLEDETTDHADAVDEEVDLTSVGESDDLFCEAELEAGPLDAPVESELLAAIANPDEVIGESVSSETTDEVVDELDIVDAPAMVEDGTPVGEAEELGSLDGVIECETETPVVVSDLLSPPTIDSEPQGELTPIPEDLASEDANSESPVEPVAVDNVVVSSETDNDLIFGGIGDDVLVGGDGNDIIVGGVSPLEESLLHDLVMDRFSLA